MPLADEVLRRASDGDRKAQQTVYEALAGRIYRTVRRIVGESDVDDVTQTAFVRLFEKLHSFRGESAFATWAHRLAVNEALQHLRKQSRRPTEPLNESAALSRERTDGLDAAELLEAGLDSLEPELRLIFHLKEVDGLSYAEIAQIARIPEGTVGSRLNRARAMLRKKLSELGWSG